MNLINYLIIFLCPHSSFSSLFTDIYTKRWSRWEAGETFNDIYMMLINSSVAAEIHVSMAIV